jgi:hypothetical protein
MSQMMMMMITMVMGMTLKNVEDNVGHGDEIPIAENVEEDDAAATIGAQNKVSLHQKKKQNISM